MNSVLADQASGLDSAAALSGFSSILKKWRGLKRCSQLDLAVEAEVSQRHISFLESGRAKPSREMVLTLSEALEMPLRERNLMLHAAGFAPLFKERPLDSAEMDAVKQALSMTLSHHEPYPAIVADRNWNLLMSNAASQALIALLGNQSEVWSSVDPSGDQNVYRMTFSRRGFRPFIGNWSEMARHLLLRLQREVADDPFNQYLADLLEEVRAQVDVEDGIADQPLAPVLAMTLKLGALELRLFSMISSFGTAQDVTAQELKVETFYPADDVTREFFKSLKLPDSP